MNTMTKLIITSLKIKNSHKIEYTAVKFYPLKKFEDH